MHSPKNEYKDIFNSKWIQWNTHQCKNAMKYPPMNTSIHPPSNENNNISFNTQYELKLI